MIEQILNTKWRTFNNKTVSYGTVDHQHLSNLFYHWKFAYKGYDFQLSSLKEEEDDLLNKTIHDIQIVLEHRFNGQILSYRPHIKFKQELDALKRMSYLKDDGKIIVDGRQIGEILTTSDFE